jgi:hypothetical protein
MWDELNKFDRGRFAGSNTLVFLPPWTSEQIDWWQENIFKPHGYYPDDLGEALSASAAGPKTITLMDMDPKANSFVIKVKGRADDMGEAWWHQRKLDLKGRLFRAEKMIVPFPDQRQGKGRLLMADLVDTARRMGLKEISLEAEDIGRYAWARIGFVPDRTAWRYHVRVEAHRRLQRSRKELVPRNYQLYREVLDGDEPDLIRQVVQWPDLVDSLKDFDPNGNPAKIAIGKAVLLETSANWIGTFDLEDPLTIELFETYLGRRK